MRIRIGNGLLPLNILVILLIAAILLFPSNILRIILGLPSVLFFPGYALVAVLFPGRGGIGGIERVTLSFGLSIAVVVLMLLILNYTPWGIRLESILYSIAFFIFAMSAITWFRQKRLIQVERFSIEFHLAVPKWNEGIWGRALTIIMIIAMAGALGMLVYAIAMPKLGEKFTEFYVLGLEGEATDYFGELVVGEEGRVIIGIVNHEYEAANYRVEVRIDRVKNNEIEPIVLEHGEEWEEEVSFVPQIAGDKQKVEFLLYKNSQAKAYLEPLRLWIDVTE